MRITFVTRKFGNVERNSHCDVGLLHIAPVRVANLVLDYNGVLAIKAYGDRLTAVTSHDMMRETLFGFVRPEQCKNFCLFMEFYYHYIFIFLHTICRPYILICHVL